MSEFDDTFTLSVQWIEGDRDITTDPCAAQNADAVRLHTPDGVFIAVWTRTTDDESRFTTWDVTESDYPDVLDNGALSGFSKPGDAIAAGLAWFVAECQPRGTVVLG
jgi:hypothetical protein